MPPAVPLFAHAQQVVKWARAGNGDIGHAGELTKRPSLERFQDSAKDDDTEGVIVIISQFFVIITSFAIAGP